MTREPSRGCALCHDLQGQFQIRTPAELRRALLIAKQNVADRTLLESLGGSALEEIPLAGPWPDVIDLRFRCADCGSGFQLAVETYHGAGGVWRSSAPHPMG